MSQLIPFIVGNSGGRKSSSKVIKYLAIFGILGAAVVAFIFLAKKFNPLKVVGSFLGKAVKNVGGFLLGIPLGIGSTMAKAVAGLKPKPPLGKVESRRAITEKYYAKENLAVRREFRRYSKTVIRMLNTLKKSEGIPAKMAGRISMVKSAFRRVNKTFIRDIPRQFDVVFNRKAKFLEGNLIGSFKRVEIIQVARDMARLGKGYGAKIALMELQAKRGGRF